MVLNVQIHEIEDGNLCAIFETNGKVGSFNRLFEFAYRDVCVDEKDKPSWYFWLSPSYRASHIFPGERKDFPLAFFLNACRAAYFFCGSSGEIPDSIEITHGAELLA